jgi:hypothetical protein
MNITPIRFLKQALTEFVGSKDRKSILLQGCGHIGLAIGGRAQNELWP